MSSVVFNSFKQRFLNGDVPREDVWKFIPVNKAFTQKFGMDDFPLEQYRSLSDFYGHNYDAMRNSFFEGIRRDIYWYKPADTDETNKPMFITSGSIGEKGKYDSRSNWEDFQKTVYMQDISGNSAISSYLASGGFYYIRKKDELRWFAARSNTGNNRIIGVLGDGIDGVIRGQIGSGENYPFQGVLDGNGHTLNSVSIVCDSTDNGLVGVLGCDGVVKNIKLSNDVADSATAPINLLCEKRIDLNHIKTDGRDINAGILVGRNYGVIENIDGSNLGSFKFSGFVPQVYSVTNKSDSYSDFYATIRPKFDNGENFYYLNSWCINSPGNICPYVGYFAEGLFAQSARGVNENGDTIAIEYAPALKSKYDVGACNVTLDLTSKCSKVAFYVKNYSDTKNSDTKNSGTENSDNDDVWGTNCVMFVGYETQNEAGKNVTYVLEMNGTAYDKKSGTGKRRYHFHCGHYDYKKYLKVLSDQPEETEYYVKYEIGKDSNGDPIYEWIPTKKVYDNGADESNDDQDVVDDEYVIDDTDLAVYTADGMPAKINSKDIQTLYFSPRNFDTSTAVWDKTTYTGKVKKNTNIDVEVELNDTTSGSGDTTYTIRYNNHNNDVEIRHFYTDNDKCPIQWDTLFIVSGKTQTEIPEELKTDANLKCIKKALRDEVKMHIADDEYLLWTIEVKINESWNGRIVCDDDDKSFFEEYFAHREKWQGKISEIHSYDIGMNSQDGIRSEGTIDITLLTIGNFQYRPFVHASSAKTMSNSASNIIINQGTMLKFVSAYYSAFNGGNTAAAIQDAYNYVVENAKEYIDNPNYYGMDRNGYWTSNVVRPDPENDSWGNLTSKKESWISTLNFNWNIMQKLFETENGYYTELTKYANLDDGDDPAYYNKLDFADEWYYDADLPHSLLNKPIRMHNMARAAYYVSPIAGANYGRIRNVVVSSDRKNVGNFVGFVGSLAGKQERGVVESARVFADDKFVYFAATPTPPARDCLTDEQYDSAYDEYEKQKAAYNFQVRYKQTPIMPLAVSNAVQEFSEDPTSDWTQWQYYPAEASNRIDTVYTDTLSSTSAGSLSAYLNEIGVTVYCETGTVRSGDAVFSAYTENPDYKFEKALYDAAAPIRAYTSAWYDDYATTATEHFDDVVTYNLRPIFNAGGCFGKIVPTYNTNKIELSGNTVNGTVLRHIDVHYILDDAVKYSDIVSGSTDLISWNTKDIHNTYGAIAGLVELQTSQVGPKDNDDVNSINMSNINVSSEGNAQPNVPLTPFGFLSYQPTELNTVQATQDSPRQKNGDWTGEYTETTWALDAPIVVNNKMLKSKDNYAFAPINQSSAAFFMNDWLFDKPSGVLTSADKKEYFQQMSNKIFKPASAGNSVNIDGNNLVYCNYDAFDFVYNGKAGVSIQSCFGSNVTFEPVIGYGSASKYPGNQEMLNYNECGATRIYEMSRYPLSADKNIKTVTNYSPVDVDILSYPSIFLDKTTIDDVYFDYTYSSTTSFVDDWTFTHNVKFTSALKDADRNKPGNIAQKATMGYVFHDPNANSADGFKYDHNYLHIGNSVSPSYIRDNIKEPGSILHTSACSGAYYDETGELVSAVGEHDFGGLLVVDKQDRTVMFIDNTNGAKIDGGSWNMACERVTYQNNDGGLLLEVK